MARFCLATVAVLALGWTRVEGYSAGPPDSVCDDPKLTPAGHEVDFQAGPSPYQLEVINQQDGSLGIRIHGSENFKGRKEIPFQKNSSRVRRMFFYVFDGLVRNKVLRAIVKTDREIVNYVVNDLL